MMPLPTVRLVKKVTEAHLDHSRGLLLFDGKPFPYVLVEDPLIDEVPEGFLVWCPILVETVKVTPS